MPLLKVLTPEETEKLGVPRVRWVISLSMRKLNHSWPVPPDSPNKPDQGPIAPDEPFFNGSVGTRSRSFRFDAGWHIRRRNAVINYAPSGDGPAVRTMLSRRLVAVVW
jgi:hypothetical protein